MNNTAFYIGVAAILSLLGLCGYWYLNPHQAPRFVRDVLPSGFELNSTSPMKNFRGPSFGQ